MILGGGAREHALGWKVAQSPLLKELYFLPGNVGTAALGENLVVDVSDHSAVAAACKEREIDLVVVGPDNYLAVGIQDALRAEGLLVFAPTKAAAEIEWSKAFAKRLMQEERIPTARSQEFTDLADAQAYAATQPLPVVIKADGLALGKGVVIAQTQEEADAALATMMHESGARVVIEEYLEGVEFSVHALCAGAEAILFPPAQDHKRALDGDRGPNTGGMGTIAPFPGASAALMEQIKREIVVPTLGALVKRERPFNGLLYPGIMLTREGPKVIEFNARFGDPETEVYMPLLESDLVPALLAVAKGSLKGAELTWSAASAACVVLASGGYPASYERGKVITGVEEAEADGARVFHFATARNTSAELLTNGGRVLGVTATGLDLKAALAKAYAANDWIYFEGKHYRHDIGAKALS